MRKAFGLHNERNAAGHVKDSKSFSLSHYQHLVKTLAGNHTVLSSFAKFQHPSAMLFVEIARKCIFSVEPAAHSNSDRSRGYREHAL